MEKNLFLTGAAGAGQSEIIRAALGARGAYAGGYVTHDVFDETGKLTGRDLLPAAAAFGVQGYKPTHFLDYVGRQAFSDNEVFRETGVRLLQEAEYYPYVMMDEIGGYELIIPQFRTALLDVLNSDLPCIGVLIDDANGEALRSSLGLGEKYSAYRRALKTALENSRDTLVLELKLLNKSKVKTAVEAWVKEYA